ncbi:5-methyltetrahydropteroyltriglutamate--homocysteine S-methyltransferase [Telmatobacter bradus]|uniref:5-methyltetrahydropteroyltriglutamate-- homocysteine S-methyltransferase n=1 Tax=Telmatobacter bradus TaxID=474953 RepID=UPI003B429D7F
MSLAIASNLGFPRMGSQRELKFALESFWGGKSSEAELLQVARQLRNRHWRMQVEAGIAVPPSNDFSLYDQVLDMVATVGAVPRRFSSPDEQVSLATYFAMARGAQDAPALEMTKWFDTNYHYVVPEFEPGHHYSLRSSKVVDEYVEAREQGIETRPVLLGPVSFVLLGKPTNSSVTRAFVLKQILPIYRDLLGRLAAAGAGWVQIDEPCLCLDLDEAAQSMYREAYAELNCAFALPKFMLTTYFGALQENLDLALSLGTAGLHVDLVRAPEQLDAVLAKAPEALVLSLGLVDGRNVWRTDVCQALRIAAKATLVLGKERVQIAPSCSLLHTPVDLATETALDAEVRGWMAFARQKLEEVALLSRALEGGIEVETELTENARLMEARRQSTRIHQPQVAERLAAVTPVQLERTSSHARRREVQQKTLRLPLLPTTTIGSFPQTAEVRKMRAEFRKGKIDIQSYDAFLQAETERCIGFQEEVGLDMLVHGEFERNDMVEYFGEQLDGFVFSQNGWVQSYGSRCVKPPIIFGDVSRPRAMTVRWAKYAQSLTAKPVKGMLTGPVTILQWSFVRDDQPRSVTCQQIALAIRDEVADLETAGIRAIQIDEPAIREGLPLRRADWAEYLLWSVDAFRLASAGVADATQIHTHMCYSEFNDIIEAIVRMDADVISIECSRSRMELLDAFTRVRYPNEIGPGVYDIHSPRIPSREEIATLLRRALEVLNPEQLWVNPDCGLKTRGWPEVRSALEAMVQTAEGVRDALACMPR